MNRDLMADFLAVARDFGGTNIACDIARSDLTVFFCEQSKFVSTGLCPASN